MVEIGKSTKRRITESAHLLSSSGIFLALTLVLIAAAFLSPAFYQPTNLLNVLRQASALGILSIAQTLVMIGGGIDLSLAATMQLAVVAMAELSGGYDELVPLSMLVCLLIGAFVGLVNGVIITRFKIPAFLVTLGTSVTFTGLRLALTNGSPSTSVPPVFRFIGGGNFGSIPVAVLILAVVAVLAHLLLTRTTFGRRLYARGANPEAARLSGVRVDAILIITYIIAGVLAVIAGLLLAGYAAHADQWTGKGLTLDSVAAVVVGGGDFIGGVGTIPGTLAGVMLVTILLNLVLLLNLNVQYQLIVKGTVVILGVAMYSLLRRNE